MLKNNDGPTGYTTNVINKAGYPQVVIIPHYVGDGVDGKRIRLRFGDDDDHVLDFETDTNTNQQFEPLQKDKFQRLVQRNDTVSKEEDQVSALNEKRREALLRASEKQELLLQNLLDAVERHRQEVQEKYLREHDKGGRLFFAFGTPSNKYVRKTIKKKRQKKCI